VWQRCLMQRNQLLPGSKCKSGPALQKVATGSCSQKRFESGPHPGVVQTQSSASPLPVLTAHAFQATTLDVSPATTLQHCCNTAAMLSICQVTQLYLQQQRAGAMSPSSSPVALPLLLIHDLHATHVQPHRRVTQQCLLTLQLFGRQQSNSTRFLITGS
jgi:hypothetical protein